MNPGLVGAFIGLTAAGIGIFVALYASGFFQYLGGRKRPNVPAVNKQELIGKLLALNDSSKPYHIIKGEETDIIAEWKIVDAKWYGIFNKSGLKESYKAYLLIDKSRFSVRCCEEFGTISWNAGLNGLIPNVHYSKSFFRGRILYKKKIAKGFGIKQLESFETGKVYDYKFDVNEIRGPIIATVEENGWEWVPVTAKRHATYKQLKQ